MEGPVKRQRYSLEPDLALEFDNGEVVNVIAYTLMMASPVFEVMLQAGMSESVEGRLKLVGKRAADFRLVLRYIDTAGGKDPPPVMCKDLPVLLQWADEYQMKNLTNRVERFLLTQEADSLDGLALAVKYQLRERTQQCLRAVSQNFGQHLDEVHNMLENEDVMKLLWPSVFKESGLRMPRDQKMTLAKMWPVIALGLRRPSYPWKDDPDLRVKVRISRNVSGHKKWRKSQKLQTPLRKAAESYCRQVRAAPPLEECAFKLEYDSEAVDLDSSAADLGWSPWHGTLRIIVTYRSVSPLASASNSEVPSPY